MTRDELWDRFIDAIDQAGQAGVAADVLVPAEVDATLAGKRFGDLTPIDIEGLARMASQVSTSNSSPNRKSGPPTSIAIPS